MGEGKQASWEERELYELLCLMLIGSCLWFGGGELGFFDWALGFAVERNLLDLVVLIGCMGVGAFAATIRKSVLLRNAMRARIEAERQADAIARHDALTGLANRRFFLETLEARLSSRQAGEHWALFMIDLDRFKPVNDLHGHAAGNAVLCAVADRLLQAMPPKSVVARLGGDEFVALTPFHGEQSELTALAQEIIWVIRAPIAWGQGQVDVDSTVGITVIQPDETDAEAIMHGADLAMYEGKRLGRGRFCFFHTEMDTGRKRRAQFEADLRGAISRNEIMPFFQPIVRLPSKEPTGFEVLARWAHPTKGLISPDVFIPVAEETGMINDLFFDLLHQACTAARAWPPHLTLAINVAPQQLQDSRMPARVLSVLTETGFAPGRLEIEITETALINDLEAARSTLNSLQNLGVKIALDDFGTGYSSLYHLRELHFDKLKIDKSYVAKLVDDVERAKLVDAIIQLGGSLSLQTTAEGIETDSDFDWLANKGCTYGQGFLFGRPMPKDAAEQFLEALEHSEKPAASVAA
jgi:diguanylate cyclase (GGDEF)-like protein